MRCTRPPLVFRLSQRMEFIVRQRLIGRLVSAYVCGPWHPGKFGTTRRLLALVRETPIRSAYGPLMLANGRDITNCLSLLGVYDDVFKEVDVLEEGMCFIDIGANAGIFSLVAAKRVGASGSVIAFEPSLPVYRFLIANAALNGLANFHPFLAAIGPQTVLQSFSSTPMHTGRGHVAASGDQTVLQVNFFADMKALLPPLIGERQVVVKIDVEGMELFVVEACKPLLETSQVTKIIVEVNQGLQGRFGQSAEELYDTIEGFGFVPKLGRGYGEHYNEVFVRT